MPAIKNGECRWKDEAGAIWLAESFTDDSEVYTVQTLLEPAPEPPLEPEVPTPTDQIE
jgi:hypothetical protein